MKRIALIVSLLASSAALAETNNGARSGATPEPVNSITDYSECGELNRPINLYGNTRGSETASYLRVKTDRGWCLYSDLNIDNPVFAGDGPFVPGNSGEGEGEGGEGSEGGEAK